MEINSLLEANDIVCSARQETYGHPLDNHERIAAIWSVVLGREVTAEQAALCMLTVKIAREVHRPKHDNIVDICGYARVYEMIQHERARRKEASNAVPSLSNA